GDVTRRVMIWKGFGDRTFFGDNGRLKKEDEKPGVIGDGDVDSCTTRHWHFVEVKFLFFSSDEGGVFEVWQLDTDKRTYETKLAIFYELCLTDVLQISCTDNQIHFLKMPSMEILRSISGIKSACLYSSDDHWHLVWEELIYIGLRLFAVNVRFDKAYLFHGGSNDMLFQLVSDMKAEYFPPKEDVILQNEAPTDFYVLVTGAVELVVTRNEVEHVRFQSNIVTMLSKLFLRWYDLLKKCYNVCRRLEKLKPANVGDGTIIMNNLLQDINDPLMEGVNGDREHADSV
nr:WD repeat-containing protein 75 [Tanacetum cinerariifolium]